MGAKIGKNAYIAGIALEFDLLELGDGAAISLSLSLYMYIYIYIHM